MDSMQKRKFSKETQEMKKEGRVASGFRQERPSRTHDILDDFLESELASCSLEQPTRGRLQTRHQAPEKEQQEETSSVKDPFDVDNFLFGSKKPSTGSTARGRHSQRRFSEDDFLATPAASNIKSETQEMKKEGRVASGFRLCEIRDNDQQIFTRQERPSRACEILDDLLESDLASCSLEQPTRGRLQTRHQAPEKEQQEKTSSVKDPFDVDNFLFGSKKPSTGSTARGRHSQQRFSEDDFLATPAASNIKSPKTEGGDDEEEDWLLRLLKKDKKAQVLPKPEDEPPKQEEYVDQESSQRNTSLGQPRPTAAAPPVTHETTKQSVQQKVKDHQSAEDLQARIVQLEEQVKTLQQERDQKQALLETVQQQHKQEMEVMENEQRSVTALVEQLSSQLEDLSSQENLHKAKVQDMEKKIRQQDEQLQIMEDTLKQQQKATSEEKARFQDVISRMDAQLTEQQRQLEKTHSEMTAEQAKAESAQKKLEEDCRALMLQINTEKEELERTKSAVLEEQQSFMRHCAEDRSRLSAEWEQFHTQEKQRCEQEAQDQADMKNRAAELKLKETAVTQERETLKTIREELDREKEKIKYTALKFKIRAEEVEAISKLAAEKYEQGEQALQEAKRVEAEHEARLQKVHSQRQQLRQQQEELLQEQIRFSKLQETVSVRQRLPVPPVSQTPPTAPRTSSAGPQLTAIRVNLTQKVNATKITDKFQEDKNFLNSLKNKSYRRK